MTGTQPSPQAAQVEQQARRSSAEHMGPTADRYAAAMELYVGAVLGDERGSEPSAAPRPGFPPSSVADVMNRRPVVVDGSASFKQVVAALDRAGAYALPVVEEDGRVAGIVTTSDLLARITGRPPAPQSRRRVRHSEAHRKVHARTAAELMTAPAITTTPTASIAQAASRLARRRIRSMPVVDRDDRLVGMVSREELVRLFLRDDEDIYRAVVLDIVNSAATPAHRGVQVDVTDGVVTLGGRIGTAAAGRALCLAVERVPGVVEVRNEFHPDVSDHILPPVHR